MQQETEGFGDPPMWLYPALADAKSALEFIAHVYPERPRKPLWMSFDIVDAYGSDAADILRRMIGLSAKQYETRERAALEFVERGASAKPSATAPAKATSAAPAKTAAKAAPAKKTAKTTPKKAAKAAPKKAAKAAPKKSSK